MVWSSRLVNGLFDHFDEAMMESLQAQVATQDTVLLGRVTYDE
jgi:hypothetical protein